MMQNESYIFGFGAKQTLNKGIISSIKYAISIAQSGDIIVLAGKGHETYQILNTGTIHLDEREIVLEALKEI